ncbi:hypothetical protein O6H91_16G092400 [Diphasiastrum complanatum]|uniref:Uncharacterized protein n=1 Tax=Diphasiastrum complanatum TaxID=34168 RepID=A0ACC2BEY4_DIPCM|nr:hypothetical protein O6H91_Y086000 [Diphasiastrum complanatum]KAJ7528271.1 hypothetical protein O6H91_16G092400 [Diphasiastrum complanatum]
MAEGEALSMSPMEASDLRHLKRMSRNKRGVIRRQGDEAAASQEMEQRSVMKDRQEDALDKDKDAGSWSVEATGALIYSFQHKRLAKKQVDADWRIFRAEDWDYVAMCVNEECGLAGGSKDWKNGKQCKYKIFNLKRRYKTEKDLLIQRGAASDWGWFLKMEALMSEPESARYHGTRDLLDGGRTDNIETSTGLMHRYDNNIEASTRPMKYYDNRIEASTRLMHYYDNGEKKLHDEPDSCSSPGSKSMSTTNLGGGFRSCAQHDDRMQMESKLEWRTHKLTRNKDEPLKKHCRDLSSPSEAFETSIGKSMQMMTSQQGETILLMREIVTGKPRRTQELENCEYSIAMEMSELKEKIDFVERDLISLKQVCNQKKREWNDAMDAYIEKSLCRNELLNNLLETLSNPYRSRRKVIY